MSIKYRPGTSNTPDDVNIVPRRMGFQFEEDTPKYWFENDPVKSHFFNTLSILFPQGEDFFIANMRAVKDRIYDKKLKQDVSKFCGQEGHHSKEHKNHQALFIKQGYKNIDKLNKRISQNLKFFNRHMSIENRLATVAGAGAEHLTSIMAEGFLQLQDKWGKDNCTVSSLLLWHVVEETEHKTVAYDVYRYFEDNPTRRYITLTLFTAALIFGIFFRHLLFLSQDKLLFKLATWRSLGGVYFGSGGLLRTVMQNYFSYYDRDFHPWQHDNRDAIKHWVSLYDAGYDMTNAEISKIAFCKQEDTLPVNASLT